MQHLVHLGQPVMVLRQWGRRQFAEAEQGIVDRGVIGHRWPDHAGGVDLSPGFAHSATSVAGVFLAAVFVAAGAFLAAVFFAADC